jgi:alpha-methylacyl-CoA racemase
MGVDEMSNGKNPARRSGPLAGVRVIDLGGIGPGPFAAMLLADMGADVVRIDRPLPQEFQAGLLHRGKRSAIIDLRDPAGTRAALKIIAGCDILIEGFRPGVTERLGLGPEQCWERNPKLVYGRMTGWGQDGPRRLEAGHDITYIALAGALHAIGRVGEPPTIPLNLVGDLGGGSAYMVMGVLAAYIEAERSGHGQVVDAAILDGVSSLMAPQYGSLADGEWVDERGVNQLDSGRPWYNVYETSDGRYMAVGALEQRFYDTFTDLMGLTPDEAERDDPTRWPALQEQFAAIFSRRTRAEWEAVFEDTDACVAPVLSMTEAPTNDHVRARKVFVTVDGVVQPGPAPRFSRTPSAIQSGPAFPGEHTREVLKDFGVDDIGGLEDRGVVSQTAEEVTQ